MVAETEVTVASPVVTDDIIGVVLMFASLSSLHDVVIAQAIKSDIIPVIIFIFMILSFFIID
jgi:hypothetical protein